MNHLIRLFLNTSKNLPKRGISLRYYATDNPPLTYIQHDFSYDEAARIFNDHDAARLFAPLALKPANQLAISHFNPLKQMYLPLFGFRVELGFGSYSGRYGTHEVRYVTGENGSVRAEYYTDWHSISGFLLPLSLDESDWGMSVYGGFQLPAELTEKAFSGYRLREFCIPFEQDSVSPHIEIDPFLKKAARAQESVYNSIQKIQISRAEEDIKNRMGYCETSVSSIKFEIESIDLTAHMLPAYVLNYPNNPVRILPAINKNSTVYGKNPLSVAKTSAVTMVLSSILAVFAGPQFALSARMAFVVFPTLLMALMTRYKSPIQAKTEKNNINVEKLKNEEFAESLNDCERREATQKNHRKKNYLNTESQYLKLLGLNPDQEYTEKEIKDAYLKKMKEVHPDVQGASNENTRAASELNKARSMLINKSLGDQNRSYSTMAVRLPPRSIYHPSADLLIRTILDEKNYPKALELVRKQEISADSHNKKENTPLTEAAKRGDLPAIEFIIDRLRASPDTSCDCPHHRTALHYAAANGNEEAVRLLLQKGANPNLLTSKGETAVDIAIAKKFPGVKKILEQEGGIANPHKNSLMHRFFGYSPTDRNRLGAPEKASQDASTTHLPPTQKK